MREAYKGKEAEVNKAVIRFQRDKRKRNERKQKKVERRQLPMKVDKHKHGWTSLDKSWLFKGDQRLLGVLK